MQKSCRRQRNDNLHNFATPHRQTKVCEIINGITKGAYKSYSLIRTFNLKKSKTLMSPGLEEWNGNFLSTHPGMFLVWCVNHASPWQPTNSHVVSKFLSFITAAAVAIYSDYVYRQEVLVLAVPRPLHLSASLEDQSVSHSQQQQRLQWAFAN